MHHAVYRRAQYTLSLCLSLPLTVSATMAATVDATDKKLDTVLVQAQRIKQALEAEQALIPGGVTVLDSDDLRQRNVTNLADMLRYVPGVWSESSSGSDEIFFSSRGSNLDATDYDMNGIKLFQDGLPVTTADGNNHNRMIDPLSMRYAVIARGANALTYGASNLGGAIDFIAPTARNSAPLELLLNAGSHGQRNARVSAGTVQGAFDGLLTLESKNWDGYRDHSEQQRQGIYANSGWQFSDAVSTRFYATYVHNDQQLPGALTQAQVRADRDQANPSALGGDYQKNVDTWRLANKTSWDIDEHSSLEFGLSYEKQSLYHPIVDKVLVDFDGAGPNPPQEVYSLLVDTDHRDLGAMLRYNLQLGAHDILAGVNYGDNAVHGGNYRNDGGRRNGLSEKVDNSATSFETYLVDRWHIASNCTLIYGAQWVSAARDVRTTDVTSNITRNPNASYSSINPRLGALYAVNENSELYASVSRLFEAPTNFELDDDVRGNDATLEPMQGSVYEVGSRGHSTFGEASRWNWEVSVYYAQIRDEILSVDDPRAPGTSLSTNIGATTHAGIEALLGASFALDNGASQRIEPLLSVTLNDFSFNNDANYSSNKLPAAPDYIARGELLYRNASGFFAGPTVDFIGQRYTDFSNSEKIGAYTLFGLRSGFSAATWEVFVELKNLFDRDYIATVSVLDRAAVDSANLNPGAPRSLYVGARLQF